MVIFQFWSHARKNDLSTDDFSNKKIDEHRPRAAQDWSGTSPAPITMSLNNGPLLQTFMCPM